MIKRCSCCNLSEVESGEKLIKIHQEAVLSDKIIYSEDVYYCPPCYISRDKELSLCFKEERV